MSTLNKRECTGAGLAAGSVLLVGGSVAASSLLDGYPVLGGQAVRYLAAGILLAAWARLQRKPAAPPGRPGMDVAGRTSRHRTGRMQRADDPGHPGRRSRQCRGHHRSGPAGHHRRRRDRRGPPPHPAGPARRSGGDRRIRSGSARRRRTDLEPSRPAVVGGCARWCRRLIPAGRAAAAPARCPRRHRLRLRHGRHPAASHRCRGPLRRRAADPAATDRDPAGGAGVPHDRHHRPGVHRLVRGHGTPRGGPHRTVQRADPCHFTSRRHADRHRHHHAAPAPRRPRRPRRRDPRPQPCPARAGGGESPRWQD